tara:strand:+ start:321 stop:914 length:594 start_codon:yes stop_codon:yes gene_type:complete
MVYNREGYAPWSLTRKAGVQSATVDGDIEVPQYIQPVLDTGFVDEKGDWKGRKSSEEQFHSFGKDEAIANGGAILAPQASGSIWPLDMTGFCDVFIGIRPTNGGNYAITAVMGPDSNSFANLTPVNPNSTLRGGGNLGDDADSFATLFADSAQSLTADVWNIFIIKGNLRNQKLLQFRVTNNSGGESDIETAFMRLV